LSGRPARRKSIPNGHPPNGRYERAESSQWIGLVKVTISITAPTSTGRLWRGPPVTSGARSSVRGSRTRAFGPSQVSRPGAGANETTTITLSHDQVEQKRCKAGPYGLFSRGGKIGPWTWNFFLRSPKAGHLPVLSQGRTIYCRCQSGRRTDTKFMPLFSARRRPSSARGMLQWEKKRRPL